MDAEELKQKKLDEMRQKYLQEKEEEQKALETEAKMQGILRQVLTEEARERLNNVRLVNRGLYTQVFRAIVMMAQKGYIEGKVSDGQVKELLGKLKNEKEIRITRK